MRNYLKAELFRNFKRLFFWMITICLVTCGLLGSWTLNYMNVHYDKNLTLEVLILIGINMIPVFTYLMGLFADISIGEELKNGTIKNIFSSGFSRGKIYICKVIEAIILVIICTIILLIVTSIGGYFVLGINTNESIRSTFQECLKRGSAAVFLWSGAIALSTLFYAVLRSGTIASLAYIFALTFVGEVVSALGQYINPIFTKMHKYLISTQLNNIAMADKVTNEMLITSGAIGLIYTIVLTVIGIMIINKRDI